MPVVQVDLLAGRPPERLERMMSSVSEAVVSSLEVPASSVHVIVREIPASSWMTGGITKAEERIRKADEAHPEAGA